MNSDLLHELCQRGIDAARKLGADEVEIAATYARGAEVSFEKNDINVAITEEETTMGVRLFKNGRQGFATTNDPETVAETVADALALAAASIADPLNGLPEPTTITPVPGLHDEELAKLGIEAMTDLGSRLLQQVRDVDARASIDSGSLGGSETLRVIANSHGVRASEWQTGLSCSLFGMAVDGDQVGSFVVDGRSSHRAANFQNEVDACARGFATKAIGLLNPGKGRSYKGKVLFSPEATASIFVSNILGMLSPAAIRKGKSPFKAELGEEIAAAVIHLKDHPLAAGEIGSSAFDREGSAKRELAILESGHLAGLPYNHYEGRAAKNPCASTGHANGGASTTPGVSTSRAILEPGQDDLKDLMAAAEGAIVVSRFSGSTNGVTGEFSGVVKGGFLVEGGQMKPVTETLIAGNLLDLFRSVIGLSKETEKLYGHLAYPWMLLDGVSVTAG